jgi:aminopeptidase-like protein/aminoglycoside N3'-acetyltransferase
MYDYDREQLVAAFRKIGLRKGDSVLVHSNIGFLGVPKGGLSKEKMFDTVFGAFMDVIGDEGTLVVPTFTFSFAKSQAYDPEATPSTSGMFTEILRKLPQALRSLDPMFSVAAVGRRAREFIADVPIECFGPRSFFDRFMKANGVICNIGISVGSTFIHYVEQSLNVPYRFKKLFTGQLIKDANATKATAIFFCQDLTNPDTVADWTLFEKEARRQRAVRTVVVGRGEVSMIRAEEVFRICKDGLEKNPWFLVVAGREGITPTLVRGSDIAQFQVHLRPHPTMSELIEALWRLPRDIVSDGYDAALAAIASQEPMTVHQYPTGTECWTWIVPEKWTCKQAYLETMDGKYLLDYANNPLHCVSYSLPFEGVVSRQDLLGHLYVNESHPDAIPFKFKYYERDWGLCCSKNLRDRLSDDKYRVVVRTEFSCGTLKVGEIIAPGRTDQIIMLCAHLCHPAQVNDDLTGVVVGLEVMRRLKERSDLRYTYYFTIVPETIGTVAYLSHNMDLLPKMRGGLFLEMLGNDSPHALQLSYAQDSECDFSFSEAVRELDPKAYTGPFRTILGNDERQYNAPGVRVPMLSISRAHRPSLPTWPYPEYHSSDDNPSIISQSRLEASRDLVLHMIDVLESNYIPVNNFKAEVFCSRYGLSKDYDSSPEEYKRLFDVMFEIDGQKSVAHIARRLNIDSSLVKGSVDQLAKYGLVSKP